MHARVFFPDVYGQFKWYLIWLCCPHVWAGWYSLYRLPFLLVVHPMYLQEAKNALTIEDRTIMRDCYLHVLMDDVAHHESLRRGPQHNAMQVLQIKLWQPSFMLR